MLRTIVTIIAQSWHVFCGRQRALAPLALLCGTLLGLSLLLGLFGLQRGWNDAMRHLEVDPVAIADLRSRMASGDQEATAALLELTQEVNRRIEAMGEMEIQSVNAAMNRDFARGALPIFGSAMVVGSIVLVLAFTAMLLIALELPQGLWYALRHSASLFFPMIGVWVWMLLRSFLWVPFLGPFLGLVLGPRLALAPVLLREGTGVRQSVQASVEATRGSWLLVFGTLLIAALLAKLIFAVATAVTWSVLRGFPLELRIIVIAVLSQEAMGFGATVLVQLRQAIGQRG